MQNAAFAVRGLDWAYVALDVPPERLAEAVSGLAALGFAGANVTAPHKAAVAELVGERLPSSEHARRAGRPARRLLDDAAILAGLEGRAACDHRRRARDGGLVRRGDVRAREAECRQSAHGLRQAFRRHVERHVRQSSPRTANAAFCIRGESECATGWPSSATSLGGFGGMVLPP